MISEQQFKKEKKPRWKRLADGKVSVSCIELGWECPRKLEYWLQEFDVPDNAYLVFGTFVHSQFARVFKPRQLKKGVVIGYYRDRVSFIKQGAALWAEVVEGKSGPRGFRMPPVKIRWLYPEQQENLWDRLFPILNGFWSDNQEYLREEMPVPIVEPYLSAELPSFRLKDFTHHVVGRIDRIQRVADGNEVWDYKTSRDVESRESLSQNPATWLYEFLYEKNRHRFENRPLLAVKMYYPHLRFKHGLVEAPLDKREKAKRERLEQLVIWCDDIVGAVLQKMDPATLAVLTEGKLPTRFLEPGGRFIKQPGNSKCWLCDFYRICVTDHHHCSVAEQLSMIEQSRLRAAAGGEQLLLEIEMPTRSPMRSVWKRQLTLQIKKQKAP